MLKVSRIHAGVPTCQANGTLVTPCISQPPVAFGSCLRSKANAGGEAVSGQECHIVVTVTPTSLVDQHRSKAADKKG
jgi:hypothetical protein